METIPTSAPPSTTGTCRTRCRVIVRASSSTPAPGTQVCTCAVITLETGSASRPAPRSCSARTTSRSETIPSTLRPSPETTRAPTPCSASSASAVRTLAGASTVATPVPLRRSSWVMCMPDLLAVGSRGGECALARRLPATPFPASRRRCANPHRRAPAHPAAVGALCAGWPAALRALPVGAGRHDRARLGSPPPDPGRGPAAAGAGALPGRRPGAAGLPALRRRGRAAHGADLLLGVHGRDHRAPGRQGRLPAGHGGAHPGRAARAGTAGTPLPLPAGRRGQLRLKRTALPPRLAGSARGPGWRPFRSVTRLRAGPGTGPFRHVTRLGPLLLDAEADGQAHLEVADVAVDDLTADLLGLEPLDVPDGLRGLADRGADGVVDARLAAADDLAQPVHVVGHGRLLGSAPRRRRLAAGRAPR